MQRHEYSRFVLVVGLTALAMGCRADRPAFQEGSLGIPTAPDAGTPEATADERNGLHSIRSSSSFEGGMEGWTPGATGVLDEGCRADWSVTRSSDRATHGAYSLKLFLDNCTDAGKVWIEKTFTVTPGARYALTMRYDFASPDFGDFNHWTIVAGAGRTSPDSAGIEANARGETGNGAADDVGYRWLDQDVRTTVTAGPDGRVVVFLGIWGTYEVARTYYVDSVSITLLRR